MRALLAIALLVGGLLVGGLPRTTAALAQEEGPALVVQIFEAALATGDNEGMLDLFAEDAVIATLNGTYSGKAEIEGFLNALVADHFRSTSSDHQVDGDTETHLAVVSSDQLRALGLESLEARAEVVVRDGKIQSFTVTYTDESLKMLTEAIAGVPPQETTDPEELPNTGGESAPLLPLALVGGLALLAGLAIRRRLAPAAVRTEESRDR